MLKGYTLTELLEIELFICIIFMLINSSTSNNSVKHEYTVYFDLTHR